MLNSTSLLAMVRKWKKAAALGRRRIVSRTPNPHPNPHPDEYSSSIASKGFLFVYSTDGKRFMVPLAYLTHSLFRELFRMSEEEFGLPTDGPITWPCDTSCMEYIISILRYGSSIDVERAVLTSIAGCWFSVSSLSRIRHDLRQLIIAY